MLSAFLATCSEHGGLPCLSRLGGFSMPRPYCISNMATYRKAHRRENSQTLKTVNDLGSFFLAELLHNRIPVPLLRLSDIPTLAVSNLNLEPSAIDPLAQQGSGAYFCTSSHRRPGLQRHRSWSCFSAHSYDRHCGVSDQPLILHYSSAAMIDYPEACR